MELNDFDLLSGHDLGQSNTMLPNQAYNDEYVLMWSKLSYNGIQPASRQGHTSIISDDNQYMYVFGGFEISERVNSTLCYDIINSKWSLLECTGDLPKPRCMHTSLVIDNLMIVHGGETDRHSKSPEINNESTIESVDDLWALNLTTLEWQLLPCLLSPLPRQGHSLTSITFNGEKAMFLFGGLNRDRDQYFDNIYICTYKSVITSYNSCLQTKHVKGFGRSPATWMTLTPKGSGPSPRYMHTATELIDSLGNNKVIVFGGLTKGKTVRSDIYVLDLLTMAWTEPLYGSTGLSKGLSGDGPVLPGLYGHSSLAIISQESKNPSHDQLIVFGGNSSIEPDAHGDKHSLYRYNLTTGLWNKILIGHQFPPQRHGHSMAIVSGWSPSNLLPNYNNDFNDLEFADKDSSNSMSAIIFGGYNSCAVLDDCWALDLRWRKIGVEQFDFNAEKRLQDTLKALYPESPRDIIVPNSTRKIGEVTELSNRNKQSIMTLNNSLGIINLPDDTTVSPSNNNILNKLTIQTHNSNYSLANSLSNQSNDKLNPDANKYLTMIHNIKKERANSEILLRKEINNNKKLNNTINQLNDQIDQMKYDYNVLLEKYNNDIKNINNELVNSKSNEEKLKAINNEMIELLSIYGINNHLS